MLFIEAVRSLGFGARFITGYLYDPALDGAQSSIQGAGATHAWADVYLPGAGWVEYDPTNGLIAGDNLIRIAVTRDPSQAVPISGTFTAKPSDFLGMTVEVTVTAGKPEAAGTSDVQAGEISKAVIDPGAIQEQIETQNGTQNSNAPELERQPA